MKLLWRTRSFLPWWVFKTFRGHSGSFDISQLRTAYKAVLARVHGTFRKMLTERKRKADRLPWPQAWRFRVGFWWQIGSACYRLQSQRRSVHFSLWEKVPEPESTSITVTQNRKCIILYCRVTLWWPPANRLTASLVAKMKHNESLFCLQKLFRY